MYDAYRCPCGQLHDSEDIARQHSCCPVDLVNVCEGCGQDYFDYDLAKECEESHKGH